MLHHASRSAYAPAPTPLSLSDLLDLTREVADEVGAGRHTVQIDREKRWYRLIRTDAFVDVWLISWATEQYAELHDHAGSLGALTVVSGELVEQRWAGGRLRSRRLRAGRGAGFPLGHVHDVVNPDPAPAVSVHAYSPPLSAMSYYALDSGSLRRTSTVLVESGSSKGVG